MVSASLRHVDQKEGKYEIPRYTWFCGSLFRTEFLRNNSITFPAKFSIGDDAVFMARVFLAQPHARKIKGTYYDYYQNPNSASHYLTDERCKSCTDAFMQIFLEIENAVLSSKVDPAYAQILFSDYLKGLLRFTMQRYTESARYKLAALLIDLFTHYPHRAEAEADLKRSDPGMIKLLASRDVEALAGYLGEGNQRVATQLRARMKKVLSHPAAT